MTEGIKKLGTKAKLAIALVVVAAIVGGVLYLSGDGGLFQGKMKLKEVPQTNGVSGYNGSVGDEGGANGFDDMIKF
jgi:hypothetical protein